ncbi:MAG: DoxX family protein [Candidatus Omnitrophica bacterium]|nr:DoxX family protein [Candidatus Omnitrophota bacterium]
MKQLAKYSDQTYALMRMVSGFMFSFHGAQIILRVFAEGFPPAPFGSQTWFGGMIELAGGLAIMLGFQTRLAAFLCSGTMAVAYFQFHWKFQFDSMFFPALNQGELAALYCFVFLYIASRGGVKWCLDKKN